MPSITPSLWFDHNMEEAATYYTSVFPNSQSRTSTAAPTPDPASPARCCRARLCWTATGSSGSTAVRISTFSEAVSFTIDCKDQDEVDYYWNRLTDGGEESQCGWCKDRSG